MSRTRRNLDMALVEATRNTGPISAWKDRILALATEIGIDLMTFDSAGSPYICASELLRHIETQYGPGDLANLDAAVTALEQANQKSAAEAKKTSAIIVRIGSRVIGGDSQFTLVLSNLHEPGGQPGARFGRTPKLVLTAAASVSAVLPTAQEGDTVTVTYVEDNQGPVNGRIIEFTLNEDGRGCSVLGE